MKRLAACLYLVISLAAAGCISIEQNITLQKDLSGTAAVSIDMDFDALVVMLAEMMHAMNGKEGQPSKAEIDAARARLLEARKSKAVDFDKEKKDVFNNLPAGVRLLEASMKEEGLKMSARFALAFDNAAKLGTVKLGASSLESTAPVPMDSPLEEPFLGLKVVDEGKTVLVTSPASNPLAGEKPSPDETAGMDEALKARMDELLKSFRIVFRVTAPFEVLEHNATRKEGNTLVWHYDAAAMDKFVKDGSEPSIRVRYKK